MYVDRIMTREVLQVAEDARVTANGGADARPSYPPLCRWCATVDWSD
jgi:hypothetical protein